MPDGDEIPTLDDRRRQEFAELAARLMTAGNFGLVEGQPQKFLSDLEAGLIHPRSVVLHRDDAGHAFGHGFLFRSSPERPWEVRVGTEGDQASPPRAEATGPLLRELAARCRALGERAVHVQMYVSPAMEGWLRAAGFTEEKRDGEISVWVVGA